MTRDCVGSIVLLFCSLLCLPASSLSATYNATGIWEFTLDNSWNNCGEPDSPDPRTGLFIINQTGDTLTALADGVSYTGTVNNTTYTLSGSYPDGSGTITETVTFILSSSALSSDSGSGSWTYYESGWGTCSGGYSLSIVKQENSPLYNATGMWTYYTDEGWSSDPASCPADSNEIFQTSLSQNGDTFTFTNEIGIFAGRVTDSRYLSSITYEEDRGMTTQTFYVELQEGEGGLLESVAGYTVWTWTAGQLSCSGGNLITMYQEPVQTTWDASGLWDVSMVYSQATGNVAISQNDNSFRFAGVEGTQIGLASGADYIGVVSYPQTHSVYQTTGTTTESIYFTLDSATSGYGWVDLYWTDGWNWDWWFDEFFLSQTATAVPPDPPTLSSPINGAEVASLTPTLTTDVFPDCTDTHRQTEWQIGTTEDFVTTILISTSETNLTSLTVPMFALDSDTTYYWRASFYGNDLTASQWSTVESFKTPLIANDLDANGIPDEQENSTDDLNGDNIIDAEQIHIIKTLDTVVGDSQVGVSLRNTDGISDANILAIQAIESTDPDQDALAMSYANRPYEMPLGLLTIGVTVVKPADTADITVYFSEAVPTYAKWFMYDPVNGWVDYEAKGLAKFSDDRMSLTIKLKDWGHGDADGIANAVIVDPGGLGLAAFVTGTVKDIITQDTVSSASITFSGNLPGEDLVINTVDGNFLTPLFPDTYSVTASASGYGTLTDSVTVLEAVAQQTKDLLMVPSSVDQDLDSDGDGLTDIDEDKNLNGIVDPGETDPLDAQDPCAVLDYHVVKPQFSSLASTDRDRVVFLDSSQSSCYEMVSCVKVDRDCTGEWDYGGSGAVVGGDGHDVIVYQYATAGDYTVTLSMTEQVSGTSSAKTLQVTSEIVETPLAPLDFSTEINMATVSLTLSDPDPTDAEIVTVIVYWGDRNRSEYSGSLPTSIDHTYSLTGLEYHIRVKAILSNTDEFHYTFLNDADLAVSIQ